MPIPNTDNPNPRWIGWGHTDAVKTMNCPTCDAKYNENCHTPKGRKKWPPHVKRLMALANTGYREYLRGD